jgi:hypothetical protein
MRSMLPLLRALPLAALLIAPALHAQREVPRLRPAPPPPGDVPAGWTAPPPAPPDTREALLESLRREPGRARLPTAGPAADRARVQRVGGVGQVAAPMTGSAGWPLTVTPQNVATHIAGQSGSGPRDRIALRLYGAEYRGPNAIVLRSSAMSMFGFQLAYAYAEVEVEVRVAGHYIVSATGATQSAQIRLDVFSEQASGPTNPAAQPSWNPGQHTLATWSGQNGVRQFPVLVELEPGSYRFLFIVRGGWMQLQQASVMPLEG